MALFRFVVKDSVSFLIHPLEKSGDALRARLVAEAVVIYDAGIFELFQRVQECFDLTPARTKEALVITGQLHQPGGILLVMARYGLAVVKSAVQYLMCSPDVPGFQLRFGALLFRRP